MNSGSSASARLIFTVPLRVFQWVMSFTKSAGSSVAFSWSRNVILGWHVVTTIGAISSSPPSSTTPRARPFSVLIVETRAFTRISAPKNRAACSHAALTAPMPPSG